MSVHVTLGTREFEAILVGNKTSEAFSRMLPLTLRMSELNGNEKYSYLDSCLPMEPANVRCIETGDLMLYEDSCVVLFYKSFKTRYRYTRIGRIEDPSGLQVALGPGGATVHFSG